MAITRLRKEETLDKLVASFGSAKSVVFAKNSGLSVADTKQLRSTLREENVTFTVAKKTLFQKAAESANCEGFDLSILEGAIGAAVSSEDEVVAAKMIATFAKKNDKLEIIAGIVDGKFLGTKEIAALSSMPSKEELYAQLLGSMQAPISGFVGISSNLITGLVRTLDQVREQKEEAA